MNVTADQLISGVIAIDADGSQVTGSLPYTQVALARNVIDIPRGVLDSDYHNEIQLVRPVFDEDRLTVAIREGYVYGEVVLDLEESVVISGDSAVTVTKGYVKEDFDIPTVGGGSGSGVFDLAKVTEYTPYAPALSAVTSVVVSGMGTFGDGEEDVSGANGTYLVTADTAAETDWKKRVYKHESADYFLYYYEDPDYPEDAYWQFGYDTDSGFMSLSSSENIASGENDWENWDWGETFTLTLDVTTTTTPEQPLVLKGVKATGYTDGEWSFADSEQNFTGFEKTPKPSFIYAVSGNKLIGDAVAVDMDVPAGTVFLFDKTLTDIIGGIPVTNYGLTALSTGIVCADGKYAEIPAGTLPADVMCDNKPWTFEIKFRCLDTASSWSSRCLFGRGNPPSRFDVIVNKTTIEVGGMGNSISAPLNDTAWHIYKITHTGANVFTTYLDDAFSKSTSSSGYNMRDYAMWIGSDGGSRYAAPFEIEYIRIGNTVEVG